MEISRCPQCGRIYDVDQQGCVECSTETEIIEVEEEDLLQRCERLSSSYVNGRR